MLAQNLAPSTTNPSPQGGGERRGACPRLSSPMQTGDGLLVRLISVGTITLDALAVLCAACGEHGNGVVEITARGSIQVRGLSAVSAPRFAETIAALGVAADDGIVVLTNPLAGLDAEEILDAAALAADLRRLLAQTTLAARLAPKVSVAVDGGDALGLDEVAADVRLKAEATSDGVVLRVSVGGNAADAAAIGAVAPEHAPETVARLLEIIAQNGRAARACDILRTKGVAPFAAAIADLIAAPARPRSRRNERKQAIGLNVLRHGSFACGIGLAFGHAQAAALGALTRAAATAGAIGMRAAPGRVLMAIGLTRETACRFTEAAETLGFIVRADDPRCRVIACAGAPICSAAHIAARAMAPAIVAAAAPFLDRAAMVHISGCAKSCAHPAAATLTVVGTRDACALVADGTTRDAPCAAVAAEDLPAAVARHLRAGQHEAGQSETDHV